MTFQKVKAATALVVCVGLGGCSIVGPMSQATSVPDGPDPERVVTVADDLLYCYQQTAWKDVVARQVVDGVKSIVYKTAKNPDGTVAKEADGSPKFELTKDGKKMPEMMVHRVGGGRVGNSTNKFTYGDVGTGGMLAQDYNSTLMQALGMAQNKRNMKVLERTDASALGYEVNNGIRTRQMMAKVKPMTSTISGDVSGLDAIGTAALQIAVGGWGGGPKQQRYQVELNLKLLDAREGDDAFTLIHPVTVKKQFVQSEIAAFMATSFNIGGTKELGTGEAEAIQRTVMQSMIRPMIYAATAELLGRLDGAPAICRRQAEQFLNKYKEPAEVPPGQLIAARS